MVKRCTAGPTLKDSFPPDLLTMTTTTMITTTIHTTSESCEDEESDKPMDENLWSNVIPEELFLDILKIGVQRHGAVPFLCRVARVCRRWYILSYHPSLWTDIDLSIGWIARDKQGLQVLGTTRLQKTSTINLTSWFGLDDDSVECILDHCPVLSSINLSHCEKLTPRSIQHLCTTNSPLTEISLSFMSPLVCSQACLTHLISGVGPQLKKLVLSNNMVDNEFSQVLTAISETCMHLEHLDISNLIDTFLTIPAVYLDVEKLQRGCPLLQTLLMEKSQIKLLSVPQETQAYSPGFPALKRFSGPARVTNDFLERTLKSSFDLESLSVTFDLPHDLHYTRIPATALKKLTVHKARPRQLEVKWHSTLKVLDFSWIRFGGTGPSRIAMVQEFERLFDSSGPHFTALHTLILCGTTVTVKCIRSAFDVCPRLYTVNLCMCSMLPAGWAKEYCGTELTFLKHVMVGMELPQSETDNSREAGNSQPA